MAVQSASALFRILTLTAVAAVQAVPAQAAARNPIKGQYNQPGRLAGWEDFSKLRALMTGAVITGTVTTFEVTIGQFMPTADANRVFTPIGKLVLANGVFVPATLGMIGDGSYAAYVSAYAGTGNVSGSVNIQGYNDDAA